MLTLPRRRRYVARRQRWSGLWYVHDRRNPLADLRPAFTSNRAVDARDEARRLERAWRGKVSS